jgi:hypothetical protein
MNAVSKFLLSVFLAVMFAGCSIIPKPVEFFQKKVKEVPTYTSTDKEVQKETADLAARKARETYEAALLENSSTSVLKPAEDTSLLTLSLTKSVGPPLNPWKGEADLLAAKLDRTEARLNERLDKFAEKQQEQVGKKIEGSGTFSVPWIVYVCGVAVFLFVGFVVLKVFLTVASMSNPGVAVGTRVASMGAKGLAKGFSQVIAGNEGFKEEVKKLFGEGDTTAKAILEIFKKNHMTAQDSDVQSAIRELTK